MDMAYFIFILIKLSIDHHFPINGDMVALEEITPIRIGTFDHETKVTFQRDYSFSVILPSEGMKGKAFSFFLSFVSCMYSMYT